VGEHCALHQPIKPRKETTNAMGNKISKLGERLFGERRDSERRKFGPAPKYPFYDSNDILVTSNRRRVVDRRMQTFDSSEEVLHLHLSYREVSGILEPSGVTVTLGRDPACDLRIQTEFSSRKHATISFRGGSYQIEDHSRNGTYVILGEDNELHITGAKMELAGSGTISLGTPRAYAGQNIIRFATRVS
jgi:hypothetical protein